MNIILKNYLFLTRYSLVPQVRFRAVDASEFMNSSRGKKFKSFLYFKHVGKDVATWLGSALKEVSMYLMKIFELLQSDVQ